MIWVGLDFDLTVDEDEDDDLAVAFSSILVRDRLGALREIDSLQIQQIGWGDLDDCDALSELVSTPCLH